MEARQAWTPIVYFHPGEMLNEKLTEMGMSIEELAQLTTIQTHILTDIAHGNGTVTADIALALEKVTKIPAHIWLKRQKGYDDYMSQKAENAYLETTENSHEQNVSYICAEPQN